MRTPPSSPHDPAPQDAALDREIAARGGLTAAIGALAADESPLLPALLARKAALEEAAEPALHVRRLRCEARDLDARAEPLWLQAAADAGLAAARRLRREPDLAGTFERRAAASEALAADLEAEALALRLRAAGIEAGHARRKDLALALRALAA